MSTPHLAPTHSAPAHPAPHGADLLATIVAATRRIVAVSEAEEPMAELADLAAAMPSRAGRFQAALSRTDRINLIAECKRRSPSKGVLRAEYDPVAIATAYAAAGAAAISVLTEPTFFDGSLEHLDAVRAAVDVPLLRKDFIVSEYQLLEARVAGADAVLLIVAALRPTELKMLHDHACRHGLDVLVEVHDAGELAIAVDAGARVVGVNNRNLRTLQVDVNASEALIAGMPPDVIAVSESGLKTADDLARLRALGYRAFLIGERFMTAADPERATQRAAGRLRPNDEGRTANDRDREDLRHHAARGRGGRRGRGRVGDRLRLLAQESAVHRSASRADDRRGAAAVRDAGRRVSQPAARPCEQRRKSGGAGRGAAARRRDAGVCARRCRRR